MLNSEFFVVDDKSIKDSFVDNSEDTVSETSPVDSGNTVTNSVHSVGKEVTKGDVTFSRYTVLDIDSKNAEINNEISDENIYVITNNVCESSVNNSKKMVSEPFLVHSDTSAINSVHNIIKNGTEDYDKNAENTVSISADIINNSMENVEFGLENVEFESTILEFDQFILEFGRSMQEFDMSMPNLVALH